MSFIGKNCGSVLFFIGVLVMAVFLDPHRWTADARSDILADYYWGSHELRAGRNEKPPPVPSQPQPLSCDSEILQIICFNKCGDDYICEKNTCKCGKDGETLKVTLRFAKENHIFNDNKYSYSNEEDIPLSLRSAINADLPKPPKEVQIQDLMPPPAPPRPALRHHIAHFCPSVKKAKTCIRTCMKQGLPAFCGKDHVCYCGHKYSSHDNKTKVDVNDVYLQFRDIYEKYFGPKIFDMEASADEEEDAQ